MCQGREGGLGVCVSVRLIRSGKRNSSVVLCAAVPFYLREGNERLGCAEMRKEQGNAMFAKGRWWDAMEWYDKVCMCVCARARVLLRARRRHEGEEG